MSTDPQFILDNIIKKPQRWSFFLEASCKAFVPVFGSFLPKSEDWFFFKQSQPITKDLLVEETSVDLFYGSIYSFRASNHILGFLVNIPKMQYLLKNDYIISMPKKTRVKDLDNKVDIFLQSSDIIVFVLDNTVQYLVAQNRGIQNALVH